MKLREAIALEIARDEAQLRGIPIQPHPSAFALSDKIITQVRRYLAQHMTTQTIRDIFDEDLP